MIKNARVLQDEFLPREVRHRDAEISHLSAALEPITRGESGEIAFLFGPSGVGKTCCAKFTVNQLREEVLDIRYQYVNCWEDHSRFKALYRILDGIGETFDIHRKSTPKDLLLDRIRDYDGPRYIVILDEVDQLEDKDLLYDLYRITNLELILIANREEELFGTVDDRINSRLSAGARIQFNPYNLDELVEILQDRVHWGLTSNAIDKGRLKLIADAAAGDARTAINILRSAARNATRSDHEQITDAVIRDAIPEAKSEIKRKNLDKLNTDQRALYEIITDAGVISPGELYDRYVECVEDPKTKRMLRNYLQKMEHYNLITADGKNRGRTYRAIQ